jgi:hypothetical protein
MAAQRQADMAVVLDDLAALGHGLQGSGRLVQFGGAGLVEQRQGDVAQALDRPGRLAPRQLQAGLEGVGLGQP